MIVLIKEHDSVADEYTTALVEKADEGETVRGFKKLENGQIVACEGVVIEVLEADTNHL